MSYVLNAVYALLIVLASPWLVLQAAAKGKYREGFWAKFVGAVPRRASDRPCVWLHAVSVGEVNLLGVVLRRIAQERPDVECVISTTTMTGLALAKQKYGDHTVFYCPLDFTWAVRTAMRRIRPNVLLLAELELWPNLVHAARAHGAKVAIFNGRLSEKSFRGYRRVRWLLSSVFENIELVAAQNDEYAKRFCALGAPRERVHVTGSLKFDGAQTDRNNPKTRQLAQLAGIAEDDVVFLAGSTQSPEEQLAIEAFKSLANQHPQLKLILVPRHPHRFDDVAALLDESGLAWRRRSELVTGDGRRHATATNASCVPDRQPRVLLVDTVGELGAWWGAAKIGFVGGSLFSSRGGQNMIEPAAYGAAVCFGPNTQNFRDVVAMLLSAGAAERVASGEELTAFVRRCLECDGFAAKLGQRAIETVRAQQGATTRTWRFVGAMLPPPRVDLSKGVEAVRRFAA